MLHVYSFILCLFVFFTTKVLHIELVSDLTSEAFLTTIRRFGSRRGKPFKIHSDNGKTFLATKGELDAFTNFMKSNEISMRNQLTNN